MQKSSDTLLAERKDFSEKQLEKIRKHIAGIKHVNDVSNFCIYITGSYGRKEASPFSDLDIFFMTRLEDKPFSKITKTLIDADLIKMLRDMGLPEFSGDGLYLQIHDIAEMNKELGSPLDDYKNFFTARLLLLLESQSLYNDTFYNQVLSEVVERYFVDFNDHIKDFRPIFLVNDIIRYWRTICLNYEHKRNRGIGHAVEDDSKQRLKAYIKNLKLGFSRKLTCYSFLLVLLCNEVRNKEGILETILQTPLERLSRIELKNDSLKDSVSRIKDEYAWFLEMTGKEEHKVLAWIGEDRNRDEAFARSREFGKNCLT